MVKHFFIPEPVVDIENKLYDNILKELEKTDPLKHAEVIEALTRDVNEITKPIIAPKIKAPKVPKMPKILKAKKVK